MSWIALLACLGLFVAPLWGAQAPIQTETVHFKSGPETISGYLAMPDSPGRHPALVVIQEWWGLNDWVKQQAREFAEHGYVVLAPDLYHGQVAAEPAEASKLARSLPRDRAIRDLKAAFLYLAAMPNVEKNRSVPSDGVWAAVIHCSLPSMSPSSPRA